MGRSVKPKRSTEELKTLSLVERQELTWEQARAFIAPDTLELAAWSGCRKWAQAHGKSPFEALCRFRGIDPNPPAGSAAEPPHAG